MAAFYEAACMIQWLRSELDKSQMAGVAVGVTGLSWGGAMASCAAVISSGMYMCMCIMYLLCTAFLGFICQDFVYVIFARVSDK